MKSSPRGGDANKRRTPAAHRYRRPSRFRSQGQAAGLSGCRTGSDASAAGSTTGAAATATGGTAGGAVGTAYGSAPVPTKVECGGSGGGTASGGRVSSSVIPLIER